MSNRRLEESLGSDDLRNRKGSKEEESKEGIIACVTYL
jgi:hypothetical protein